MKQKIKRLIETITATDGTNNFEIQKWQSFIQFTNIDSEEIKEIEGLIEYQLSTGEHVNTQDGKTFETIHRKTKLYKT